MDKDDDKKRWKRRGVRGAPCSGSRLTQLANPIQIALAITFFARISVWIILESEGYSRESGFFLPFSSSSSPSSLFCSTPLSLSHFMPLPSLVRQVSVDGTAYRPYGHNNCRGSPRVVSRRGARRGHSIGSQLYRQCHVGHERRQFYRRCVVILYIRISIEYQSAAAAAAVASICSSSSSPSTAAADSTPLVLTSCPTSWPCRSRTLQISSGGPFCTRPGRPTTVRRTR